MAATPATIDISFIANYNGPHRICWRIGSSGAYTCQTVNCAGGGATCTTTIAISVDNETCANVDFEGYAQPSCIDINSTDKRVAFQVTFVPTPACNRYIATCTSVPVLSLTLNVAGTNYPSPPALVISGGGGSGATGHVVTNGAGTVISIVLDTPGSGYTSVPAVTIANSPDGSHTTVTAVLDNCPALTSPGCTGTPGTIPAIVPLGSAIDICAVGAAPSVPTGFTSVQNGNCACSCINAKISVTGGVGSTLQYYYTKCNGAFVSGFLSVGGSPSFIQDCVVNGSVITRNISGTPTPAIVYTTSCP